MQIYQRKFDKGLITQIEDSSVPRGGSEDCLNWHFLGDRIELRRGQKILGSEVAGSGRVTFVKVAKKYSGTEVLFWGYARKFLYYDTITSDNVEIGSDLLPVAASGEDIAATLYQSIAGSFVYLSSPNSSVYKISVANPGDVTDLAETTYRGYIKATLGRMFLWNRKDKFGGGDKTGLQLSCVDRDSLADYSFISAEDVGTGDGSSQTFSGTLAFKALSSKKTCHFVRIAAPISALTSISAITAAAACQVTSAAHGLSAGDAVVIQDVVGMTQINKRIAVVATIVDANNFTIDIDTSTFTAYSSGGRVGKAELFTDDRTAGLTGNQSGTGTINYTTGAWSVVFATAPVLAGEVVADYYTEDATDQGIVDFNQGSGSSIADSMTFRQDDAGEFMNIGPIGSSNYCLHKSKTYNLRLISSTEITNLLYREKVGIPYWRATVATGDGIYYLDLTETKNPAVRLLVLSAYAADVIPKSISNNLDLSSYLFDTSVMFEWGKYICFTCRTSDSTVNNRLFMYHKIWHTWEVHDYRISDMATYGGALIGGDSGSNNIFKLFTDLADQDAVIPNYFLTGDDDLGKEGVKDLRRFEVAGMIGNDQQLDVSYSLDGGAFILAKSILGNGSYVSQTQRKVIGNSTLGEDQIGGGNSPDSSIWASPYQLEFPVLTSRFERIRIKFEAKAIGYVSVSEYGFVDVRDKGKRLPSRFVAT